LLAFCHEDIGSHLLWACAITTVQELLKIGMDVTDFITIRTSILSRNLRRREGVAQMAERLGIPVIYKDEEYDPRCIFGP
jgi:hypothetical protein